MSSAQLTNVYVRNVPLEWTHLDLIALFSKYGVVTSAKVLYNPMTTASRGMGFVRFRDHHDATLAISKLEGYQADGQSKGLTCKFAKDQSLGIYSHISLFFVCCCF